MPGAGDGDRVGQEPVREGSVAARRELQDERDHEQRDLSAAAAEVPVRLQVVRSGLPAGGRQDLHNPEEEDDLRNLRGYRRRKEAPDHRQLAVRRQIPAVGSSSEIQGRRLAGLT